MIIICMAFKVVLKPGCSEDFSYEPSNFNSSFRGQPFKGLLKNE